MNDIPNTTNMNMPLPAMSDSPGTDIPNLASALQTIDSEFAGRAINAKWFGCVGDGSTDNTNALSSLMEHVNSIGGKCTIIFSPGQYNFTPSYSTAGQWRTNTMLVDVTNVTIIGYGATLRQIKNPSWTAGDSSGNQESPIQFRSSGNGTCNHIRIYGLKIQGDLVPYSSSTGDGNCCGIHLWGVTDVWIQDCDITGWGTDGLTVGTTYGAYPNTYHSARVKVTNCKLDQNTRQGASVTGADDVQFSGCRFSNTIGGSFGFGLDMEANAPDTQQRILVNHCIFQNNYAGAINTINTSIVNVTNCVIDEETSTSSGAIICDGNVNNVLYSSLQITAYAAALYTRGSNITNLSLKHSKITTINNPSNYATIRINAALNQTSLSNIKVSHCEFTGTGGFYVATDGDFYFEDNVMNVGKQSSSNADVFGMNYQGVSGGGTGKAYVRRNKITIGSDVTFTTNPKAMFIVAGRFENNELAGTSTATCTIQDYNGGRTVFIGHNIFSQYFYYVGEGSGLTVTSEGSIKEMVLGDYSNTYRTVHGGSRRILNGQNAQVGDVTFVGANGFPKLSYICTVAGSPGTWRLKDFAITSGTTAARPSAGASDIGLQYLDTTLAANGELITWNGSAWVNSSGTTV